MTIGESQVTNMAHDQYIKSGDIFHDSKLQWEFEMFILLYDKYEFNLFYLLVTLEFM